MIFKIYDDLNMDYKIPTEKDKDWLIQNFGCCVFGTRERVDCGVSKYIKDDNTPNKNKT